MTPEDEQAIQARTGFAVERCCGNPACEERLVVDSDGDMIARIFDEFPGAHESGLKPSRATEIGAFAMVQIGRKYGRLRRGERDANFWMRYTIEDVIADIADIASGRIRSERDAMLARPRFEGEHRRHAG